VAPVGVEQCLALASGDYEFLGAYEEELGGFAMASLYSPMLQFTCQEDAVAVATAALDLVRVPADDNASTATSKASVSRRGFLLGRGA
jgi:[NiFe] hydrogenase assembly HybE family chaperone